MSADFGLAVRIAALYAAAFAGNGLYLTFYPIWLAERGFPAAEIGLIIGPAGKNIRSMQETFECKISIEDGGMCTITGVNSDSDPSTRGIHSNAVSPAWTSTTRAAMASNTSGSMRPASP